MNLANTNPEWLARYPDLADITDTVWLQAVHTARIRTIPAGTTVFRSGDPCHDFTLLLTGCVRVCKVNTQGRELTLYRVNPGEACIMTIASLLDDKLYSVNAITENECQVVSIPAEYFKLAFLQCGAFQKFIMSTVMRRIGQVMSLAEDMAFSRLDMRLARDLCGMFQDSGNMEISVTHQELADRLGASRETISRLLEEFAKKGCLELRRGHIRLKSIHALIALTNSI